MKSKNKLHIKYLIYLKHSTENNLYYALNQNNKWKTVYNK